MANTTREVSMKELLEKYIRILKLNDWEINCIEEPSLDSSAATLLVWNDYKAVVKIKAELSLEEKEKSLIHELVHLIYRDAMDIGCDSIEHEYTNKYFVRQIERAIEKTAKIVYELSR